MNCPLTTAVPAFGIALTLTAVLAISADQDPLIPRECSHASIGTRPWLPCMLLAALAIASSIFGILDPQQFALASGEVLLDRASFDHPSAPNPPARNVLSNVGKGSDLSGSITVPRTASIGAFEPSKFVGFFRFATG